MTTFASTKTATQTQKSSFIRAAELAANKTVFTIVAASTYEKQNYANKRKTDTVYCFEIEVGANQYKLEVSDSEYWTSVYDEVSQVIASGDVVTDVVINKFSFTKKDSGEQITYYRFGSPEQAEAEALPF